MSEHTKRSTRFSHDFKNNTMYGIMCDYRIHKNGKPYCALKSCKPLCEKCHVMFVTTVEKDEQ